MKSFIVLLCALSCAYAVDDKAAEIITNEYNQSPDGAFDYKYETSNGIQSEQHAIVKPVDKDQFALEIQGSNQYTDSDGQTVQLTYIANENGFQPQGAHLPTPPPPEPIPDYILRALEYIEAHPYTEKKP